MRNATAVRQRRPDTRLLVVRQTAFGTPHIEHGTFAQFADWFRRGDVLVVNDAATVPASFSGTHAPTREPIEFRLAVAVEPPFVWDAALFGRGDWRTKTENRPAPPDVRPGDRVTLAANVVAEIVAVHGPRFVRVRFAVPAPDGWAALYRAGAPIQYSYLEAPLAVWDQQTAFSGPPAALEPPSASFPFSWAGIFALQERGVRVVSLTHAAGISTTGDAQLDRSLPFPERYFIPEATAKALRGARRVVALGTSVARALESSALVDGQVRAGEGIARLRMSRTHRRRVVDGIVTGLHEEGASHLDLLECFVSRDVLEAAYAEARARDYLWHEYGDACLLLGQGRS